MSEKVVFRIRSTDTTEPGPRGEPGDDGAIGPTGPEGPQGPQGREGPEGSRGPEGEPGPEGTTGPQGDTGPEGSQGEPGEEGRHGALGDPGEPGKPGDDGRDGERGEGGEEGRRGVPGLTGEDGDTGKAGAPGKPGPSGTAGVKGTTGSKGTKGTPGKTAYQVWLDDGHEGTKRDFLKSLKGKRGPAGYPGEPGPEGQTGAAGEKGADGAQGIDGVDGDPSPRVRGVAVLSTDVDADTTISTSTNATGTFLDYSGVTFEDDVEIHINGVLMRSGAGSGSDFDVYPAGTASDGDFACEFDLIDTDVIQMFIGGGGGAAGAHDMGGALHTSGTELATRIVEADGAGGTRWVDRPSGSATWLEDAYTPTLGQVTFILSQTPTEPISLMLNVNGVEFVETDDYTLSGTNITWLDTDFSMETSDKVVVQYK